MKEKLPRLNIFLNQNGQFCELSKLYWETDFDEVYKDILKEYGNDIRASLIDRQLETQGIFNPAALRMNETFGTLIEALRLNWNTQNITEINKQTARLQHLQLVGLNSYDA